MKEDLERQLWDFVRGSLAPDHAERLGRRICSDPEIARKYAEVVLEHQRKGAGSRRFSGGENSLVSRTIAAASKVRGNSTRNGRLARGLNVAVVLATCALVAVVARVYFESNSPIRQDVARRREDRLWSRYFSTVTFVPPQRIGSTPQRVSFVTSGLDRLPRQAKLHYRFLIAGKAVLREGEVTTDGQGRGALDLPGDAVGDELVLEWSHPSGTRSPWKITIPTERRKYFTQVLCDQTTYRPGETIFLRTLTRSLSELSNAEDGAARFEILDPAGQRVAGPRMANVNSHGVGSGSLALPKELEAGDYVLRVVSPLGRFSAVEKEVGLVSSSEDVDRIGPGEADARSAISLNDDELPDDVRAGGFSTGHDQFVPWQAMAGPQAVSPEARLVASAIWRNVFVSQAPILLGDVQDGGDDPLIGLPIPASTSGRLDLRVHDYRFAPPRLVGERSVVRDTDSQLQIQMQATALKAPDNQWLIHLQVRDESERPTAAVLGVVVVDADQSESGPNRGSWRPAAAPGIVSDQTRVAKAFRQAYVESQWRRQAEVSRWGMLLVVGAAAALLMHVVLGLMHWNFHRLAWVPTVVVATACLLVGIGWLTSRVSSRGQFILGPVVLEPSDNMKRVVRELETAGLSSPNDWPDYGPTKDPQTAAKNDARPFDFPDASAGIGAATDEPAGVSEDDVDVLQPAFADEVRSRTLYWNPSLSTDSFGSASTKVMAFEGTQAIRIRVEAHVPGRWGYAEQRFPSDR